MSKLINVSAAVAALFLSAAIIDAAPQCKQTRGSGGRSNGRSGGRSTPLRQSRPASGPARGPATPNAGRPGAPGAGPAKPSPYLPTSRGPSSLDFLVIDWDLPVYHARKLGQEGDISRAVETRHALPLAQALELVAGDDPRPLLVLRECLSCNGTDDALLTRQENNERTFLLSRWFHCIKLTPEVTKSDHPFHALFADDHAAHLFVAQKDGSGRIDLTGDRSRNELWKAMNSTLAVAYEKVPKQGPKDALAQLFKLLDKLDTVDAELTLKARRLEGEAEGAGPLSQKAIKLDKQVAALKSERAQLRAKAMKASHLLLRDLKQDAVEPVTTR